MRDPIGCDSEGARRYLGCSAYRWKILRNTRRIVPVDGEADWYSYQDLDAVMAKLRADRDKAGAKVLHLPPAKKPAQEYGTTDELLKEMAK